VIAPLHVLFPLAEEILDWYPEFLPVDVADVLAAQMNLTREEVRAIHRRMTR
jgi:hypothetical protein